MPYPQPCARKYPGVTPARKFIKSLISGLIFRSVDVSLDLRLLLGLAGLKNLHGAKRFHIVNGVNIVILLIRKVDYRIKY